MPQFVNSFKAKKSTETDPTTYNIGVLAENVCLDDSFSGATFNTLKTFYESIKEFFKRQMHMIYQGNKPANPGIVEWYEVKVTLEGNEQTNNPDNAETYVSVPGITPIVTDN